MEVLNCVLVVFLYHCKLIKSKRLRVSPKVVLSCFLSLAFLFCRYKVFAARTTEKQDFNQEMKWP